MDDAPPLKIRSSVIDQMVDDINQGVEKPFESSEGIIKSNVVSRVDDYFKNVEQPETPKQAPQAEAQQPEPAPSSEKATEVTVEEPKADVVMPEAKQPQTETPTDAENPRTAQRIQELLEENKKLKRQFNEATSVFDNLRPQIPPVPAPVSTVQAPYQQLPYLNQQQVQTIQKNFVQPDGTVDIDGLNRALNDANVAAYQSRLDNQRLQTRLERFEENQQALVAHAVVPEIDPKSDKFDPILFEATKDKLLRNMYEGKEKRSDPNYLRDVALEVKKLRSKDPEAINLDKVKEDAVAQYKLSLQQKQQQGPIESGKGESRSQAGLDELRQKTRSGDPFALEERLKKAGIIS